MPIIYKNKLNAFTKIGVWHITEAEDFFLQKVSLQRSITHPHKRLQHLAGRLLLLELYPDFPISLIQIAETRKPFLENDIFHFSISHCGNYAAAIVSTKNRVGVDIEIPQLKVERIQHKFLTVKDYIILSDIKKSCLLQLTFGWSIKEAMFKWQGIGEVDFKKHMKIVAIRLIEDGFIANCVFCKTTKINLEVFCKTINGNILCWVVT
ncbi:MAG: 4'-phosphopantetheinyl transferase superfamily protein [Ferruginibacter sp.]|nr:4'-phosphopantetheinyl transferase superfamily protein [Ferruginibacter sp.]